MPSVTIPAEHFTNNVKKNYQEHKSALIREFVQNSVDSGASYIKFNTEINDDVAQLIVEDDGCGMTRDILVNALLTMSGSYKGPNSIGGFGAAKEILLFQHTSYEIVTRKNGLTTAVLGSQLDYEFIDRKLDHDGTLIKIIFHSNFEYNLNFDYIAKDYLSTCETSSSIYWDNELIQPDFVKGNKVNLDIDWADVYAEDIGMETNYAYVRINGVTMFKQYVAGTNYRVVIEVTKPSLEILTVNRDGFTWQYSSKLGDLVHQVAVDSGSFGLAFGYAEHWHGNHPSYEDIEFNPENIMTAMDDMFQKHEKSLAKAALENAAARIVENINHNTTQSEVSEIISNEIRSSSLPDSVIDKMIEYSNDLVCDHKADFFIKVTGKGIDDVPNNLKPGNWNKRIVSLAKLWKRCIKLTLKSNNICVPYAIGWVLDNSESVYASYYIENGVHVFSLNPLLTWMKSSNHSMVFHKMLLIACHEVAHLDHQYHNERFTDKYEMVAHNALCEINKTKNSWWKVYLSSKHEVI